MVHSVFYFYPYRVKFTKWVKNTEETNRRKLLRPRQSGPMEYVFQRTLVHKDWNYEICYRRSSGRLLLHIQLPSAPPSHRVQKMAVMMHLSQIKDRDVPQSSLFPPSNFSLERGKEGVVRGPAINYEYYGGTRRACEPPFPSNWCIWTDRINAQHRHLHATHAKLTLNLQGLGYPVVI
jgi:hypothetical protein